MELRAVQLSNAQNDLLTELDEAQRLALIDPLTRIWNRRGMDELLKRRWAEALRNKQLVVVVMSDIDHFKSVNDTHGHHTGDVVLQVVSKRLVGVLREHDAVGRVGGEEFLILLTGCEPAELKRTVERIRLEVAKSQVMIPNGALNITLSFGVAAQIPTDQTSYQELIKFADKALYLAKNAGRNRVELDDSLAA